ncbi:MAG TPA: 6-carboxytetrahydropterin synthase QueD [Thermodesulfobacteriota bacterium]|nr:6-carboxytetrahydropterin synthase QueD [Thermodesulfobacteriota bacterium]
MYELVIEAWFSSAHNLREYEGACERLHGHNWKVEVHVRSETLDKLGMVMDFKTLKTRTNEVLDALDHRYLNDIPPFDKDNTTAENIARYIYAELSGRINDDMVRVSKIRVWESEKAAATYYE